MTSFRQAALRLAVPKRKLGADSGGDASAPSLRLLAHLPDDRGICDPPLVQTDLCPHDLQTALQFLALPQRQVATALKTRSGMRHLMIRGRSMAGTSVSLADGERLASTYVMPAR